MTAATMQYAGIDISAGQYISPMSWAWSFRSRT